MAAVAEESSAASRRAPSKRVAIQPPQCPAAGSRPVGFAKALSGATFLTADGQEVRLSGVLGPGEDGQAASREQTERARTALAAVLRSGSVSLAEPAAPDRYGRIQAQVFAADGWVQGVLLRAGDLRTAPDGASALCVTQLFGAEDTARLARAGFWRDGVFSLRSPAQLGNRTGTFQIVEGTVQSASVNKGRAYINFGPDYRTDFTVTVSPQDMKAFRQARFDVKKLAGQRVRVRGWLEFYNGPEIEIATPAAIQLLD